jgi:hypothetical protein
MPAQSANYIQLTCYISLAQTVHKANMNRATEGLALGKDVDDYIKLGGMRILTSCFETLVDNRWQLMYEPFWLCYYACISAMQRMREFLRYHTMRVDVPNLSMR